VHGVPSDFVGFEQTPDVESHTPTSWHWSSAVHVTAVPPHVPLVHISVVVHLLPSSQVVPSPANGLEQAPDVGSHVPATWHWSSGLHATAALITHAPAWQ
jgi:hypothetical protein